MVAKIGKKKLFVRKLEYFADPAHSGNAPSSLARLARPTENHQPLRNFHEGVRSPSFRMSESLRYSMKKYAPKKFSTTKLSLESFQISIRKEADFEVKEKRKRPFGTCNSLCGRLICDLYINRFRFVYRLFLIYI
ncbi:hypothetical protein HQ50_06680 [Porphyromonas sp. COT-052 OH4946]|nr:hypothetical protein HQ50_06680 [Porphyromonas sp. COT-052 OH4946]